METIRIFISSPGDVAEERDRAKSVVEELRRRYAGRLDLRAVLWEDLPLTADTSFQQGIDLVLSERGVNIAVFILWSRLGSPLGAFIRKPDGADYRSGTEREWDLMWRARAQSGGERPRIIVYTRRDESSFDERLRGKPTGEKEDLIAQKKLVEEFIAEEFHDADGGANIRAYHSFDRPTTFAQRLRIHLQELLDPLAGGSLAEPVWHIAKMGSPFLGLDAFEFEHAPVFFGREDEIVAVRQLLRQQARRGCAFVLITGASGSGKSSLVRAGVLPAISAHEIDGDVAGWRRAVLTPAEGRGDLLLLLARAVTAEAALPAVCSGPEALTQLAADFTSDPEMVCRRVLRPALAGNGQPERLIVFIDQIEEMFSDQRSTAEMRESFFRALEAMARSGCAWVIATVRSDFYAQCQSSDALMRMKAEGGQFDLVPPGADALDRLIRLPAALAGLRFEKRGDVFLADVILRDATTHRELLPLLEYLLHQLCAERTEDGVLTFASYAALGGVEGALARRADAVIAEMRPNEATLDALLAALVTLSGDEQESFVRRRVARADLERDEASRALIATFILERLLTSSALPGGQAIVTVAHEALFRVWPYAVAWLGRNREFLRLRANVAQSFARWQSADRDDSLLLPSGLPLEEAGHLLRIEAGRLESAMRGYIDASLAHRDAERTRNIRRRRIVLATLSTLTALAVIGAIFAVLGYRESSYNFEQANREKHRAETEADRARSEAGNARQRALEAESANRRNREQLHAESMADLAFALKAWQEDFDAEQSGGRAAGFHGKSPWHEAVALLTRALESEPGNARAAQWLYSTLLHRSSMKRDWPIAHVRHDASVRSVSFSPDGTRLVTAGDDRTARVWDAASGKPIGEAMRHQDVVLIASFSPDGTRVLTAGWDKTARVWDAATGKEIGEPMLHGGVVAVARFSSDGSRIVTCNARSAQVWDASSMNAIGQPMAHTDFVTDASFSLDGTTVLTVTDYGMTRTWNAVTGKAVGQPIRLPGNVKIESFSPNGTLVVVDMIEENSARLCDAASGKPIGEPMPHDGSVRSARFSPDGTSVVTASNDKTARMWNAANGKPMGEPMRHDAIVTGAVFSPDGRLIVTTSYDKSARVWDAASGRQIGEPMRHDGNVLAACFSPDGTKVATAGEEGVARVWEVARRRPIGEPLNHKAQVERASFSPDGTRVLTASWDHTARMWDAASGEGIGGPLRHDDRVWSASFSPDGARIVTASWDATARVWDAASGMAIGEPMRHEDRVWSARFSPDGTRVVTASTDKTARVWSAADGKEIGVQMRHEDIVNSARFSPDGMRVITAGSDNTVRIWDAATGKEIGAPLREDGASGACFSPDGSRIVTTSNSGAAHLWDAKSLKAIGDPMRYDGGLADASFSLDGTRIVTASTDGAARVWDAATGKELGEPMRHDDYGLSSAAFSADGTRVVTASYDNTAGIWDVASGRAIGEHLRHQHTVNSASFSPDGSRVVTASSDYTARIVEVATERRLKEISSISPSILKWARFVAGLRFSAEGDLQEIPGDERRAEISSARLPVGPWAELAQWLNDESSSRKNSPGSIHTSRQLAERERDFDGIGTATSLEYAIEYDSTVPLARLLLAEANEQANDRAAAVQRDARVLQQAAFLRRYDLDRLAAESGSMKKQEAAALWARAAEILLLRPEAKVGVGIRVTSAREEASKAAQTVLNLDPENANALRQKANAAGGLKH